MELVRGYTVIRGSRKPFPSPDSISADTGCTGDNAGAGWQGWGLGEASGEGLEGPAGISCWPWAREVQSEVEVD